MKPYPFLPLVVTAVFCIACVSTPGARDDSVHDSGITNISARGAIGGIAAIDSPLFEGNGGTNIRLAILAPETQGDVPDYLPLYVQGLLNNNFGRYSNITLIDRQNLNRIIAEQNIAASGNYSDADFITIGNLTNTGFFLFGTIQRLSGGRYSLQLSLTEAASGVRRASSMKDGTIAELEITGAIINQASADLLGQMGVRLTSAGQQALLAGNTAAARTENNLARGIRAQAAGSEVEALLNFSQSVAYDPSQMEAISRLTSLSSAISGGTISEKIVNDFQARAQWLSAFKETAKFFNEHPPFEITFDPNLIQIGNTDYARGTADLGMRIALEPSGSGFGTLNTLLEGLSKTGQRSVWGFDGWPLLDINPKDSATVVFGGKRSFSYRIEIALLNENSKTLGKNTITLDTGEMTFSSGAVRISPPNGTFGTVQFSRLNINDLTNTFTIVIVSVNGIPTSQLAASGYMRIDAGDLEGRAQIAELQERQEEQQQAQEKQRTEQQREQEKQRAKARAQPVRAAFFNLFLGAGSLFVQNDAMGAMIISSMEGLGAGLAVWGYMDRDKQGEKYIDSEGKEQTRDPRSLFYIGIASYSIGVLTGIVRPFVYQQSGARIVYHPPPWNIDFVSDNNGNAAVQLSYTLRY